MKNKDLEVSIPDISDVDKAKKLLAEEESKKANACADEVNAVLAKHGYAIEAVSTVQLKKK